MKRPSKGHGDESKENSDVAETMAAKCSGALQHKQSWICKLKNALRNIDMGCCCCCCFVAFEESGDVSIFAMTEALGNPSLRGHAHLLKIRSHVQTNHSWCRVVLFKCIFQHRSVVRDHPLATIRFSPLHVAHWRDVEFSHQLNRSGPQQHGQHKKQNE